MNNITPTKIAGRRLPFSIGPRLPHLRFTIGGAKFGHVKLFQQQRNWRGYRVGSIKKRAWSLEKYEEETSIQASSSGIVRSATETNAKEAIQALKSGKVIAVPTDTLYGLACDACSMEAVNRIYEIKGRKRTSPLAICVGDVSGIERFAVIDHLPHGLLDCLLPGPVTVVLMKGDFSILEKSLNAGSDSIGVRVPDSNFIRVIARGSGTALALTSANLSGTSSCVDITEFKNLWENCAYIYDGGVLPSGREGSTIVDLTRPGKYKILRPGSAKEETVSVLERHGLLEDGTAA